MGVAFLAKLPPRTAVKKDGTRVEIFAPIPQSREDKWTWIDTSSNNNLWIISRIPDPWATEVIVKIGQYKSSSKGGKRERHPIRCQLLIFPPETAQGDEVRVQISREIYASSYAYHIGESLASLHFPWPKKEDQTQMWLSYEFFR